VKSSNLTEYDFITFQGKKSNKPVFKICMKYEDKRTGKQGKLHQLYEAP